MEKSNSGTIVKSQSVCAIFVIRSWCIHFFLLQRLTAFLTVMRGSARDTDTFGFFTARTNEEQQRERRKGKMLFILFHSIVCNQSFFLHREIIEIDHAVGL